MSTVGVSMKKSRDLTSIQQPGAPVKTPKEAQPKPTHRSEPRKPTADQVRLHALIAMESKEAYGQASNVDVEKKVRNVSDITGKDAERVFLALVDCDMDESQAVQRLVEGAPVDEEWHTSGGGKKKKQQQQRIGGDRGNIDVITAPGYEGTTTEEKKGGGGGGGGTFKAASKSVREGYGGSVVVTEKESGKEAGFGGGGGGGSGRGGGRSSFWSSGSRDRGGRSGGGSGGTFVQRDGTFRGGKLGHRGGGDNPRFGNHGRPGRGKYKYSRGKGDGHATGGKLESPEAAWDSEDVRREDSKGRATGKGTWTNRKETSEWNGISEESRPWTVAEPDVKSPAVSNNRDEGQQRGIVNERALEDPAIISIQMSATPSMTTTATLNLERPRRQRVIKRGPSQIPTVPVEMPDVTFDPRLDEEFSDLTFDCGSRLTPEPEDVEEVSSPLVEVSSSPSLSEGHLPDLSTAPPLPPEASSLINPIPQEITQPPPPPSDMLSSVAHHSQSPLLSENLQEPEPFVASKVSSLSPVLRDAKDSASRVLSPPLQDSAAASLALGPTTGMPPAPLPMPDDAETVSMTNQLALSSNTTSTTSVSTLPTATTHSGPGALPPRSGSGTGKHAPPGMYHPSPAANQLLLPSAATFPYMMSYQGMPSMDYELLRMQNAISSRDGSISSGAGSFDKGYPRDVTSGNPISQQPMLNPMYYPNAPGLYMPPVFGMPPYVGFPYQMPPTKGGPSGYHGGASFGQTPGSQNFPGEQEFTKGTYVSGANKANQGGHRGALSSVEAYKTTTPAYDGQKGGGGGGGGGGYSGNPGAGMGSGVQGGGSGSAPLLSSSFVMSGGASSYGAAAHVGGRGGQSGGAKSAGGKYGGGGNWQS
ncbi:keratin, type I cytoskeletal 9-like isoform X2 [Oscarella lobularis]|uniref:keratin, type I cytoskeletal 9-like isoform X2 n=1 Tax=Oscarella lobularis TaxID=121494 RepID=UPI00331420BD